MTLLLASHVVVRNQVHAVTSRRYEADVGYGVESNKFVKGDRLVHKMDWHELDGACNQLAKAYRMIKNSHTEFTVDTAHKLIDHCSQVLILFHILSAWYGNLNENNFANPFGMLAEENFQSMEFLWNALDVVESVDANNEFDTVELAFERCDTFLHFWLFEAFFEFRGIDADGKSANCDHLAVVFYTIGCSL